METGFVYMTFRQPKEPDVIYIEAKTGAAYLDKPREHDSYKWAIQDLVERALSTDDSREMIAKIAKEFIE